MNRRLLARSRAGVVLATAGLLLVSACGGGSGSSESGSSDKPSGDSKTSGATGLINVKSDEGEPVKGGTVTISEFAEARSLDPTKTISNVSAGANATLAIYDALVRYDFDKQEFEPWLAKSLEPNKDFTVWTLKLRDGVKFSDGTPLNANAVLGSIGYYMKNKGNDIQLLATSIADMKPTDETTVTFTLRQPWATFPMMMAQGAGFILAPASYSGGEFKPIGAGPFKLEKYAPQEELVLAKNPGYWKGEPNLDKLRFNFLATDDARVKALQSGDVDAAVIRDPKLIEELVQDNQPAFSDFTSVSAELMLNQREGKDMADVNLRKAVAMAVNPDLIRERVRQGAGIASTELFPKPSRWNNGVKAPEFDIAGAKKLVDQAKGNGFDGTIDAVFASSPSGRAEALAVSATLEQAGIKTNIKYANTITDQIQMIYVEHAFDIARASMSIPESVPFVRLYNNLNSQSGLNAGGYNSPEMDKLLTELQEGDTFEGRKAVVKKIEELWQKEIPGLSFSAGPALIPWSKDVHGVVPTVEGLTTWGEAWKSN